MKICYKRANNTWKTFDPTFDAALAQQNVQNALPNNKYLTTMTVYLQEVKTDPVNRIVRVLLDKRVWLTNYQDNLRICMQFSQFNDIDELKTYQQQYFLLDFKAILQNFLKNFKHLNIYEKIFCVFICKVPVKFITSPADSAHVIRYFDENFDPIRYNLNTIGKQYQFLQSRYDNKDKIISYLNHLWGKSIFNDEFVTNQFNQILSSF